MSVRSMSIRRVTIGRMTISIVAIGRMAAICMTIRRWGRSRRHRLRQSNFGRSMTFRYVLAVTKNIRFRSFWCDQLLFVKCR